jgi:hypothetical protein
MESILNTIKQLLGIPIEDNAFDTDIIVNINSVFMNLNQLGIGPATVYFIEDNTQLWSNFLVDEPMYAAVKTYIYLKVKMVFDPPTTSFILDAMGRQIQELEWRLAVQVPIPPDPIEPVV